MPMLPDLSKLTLDARAVGAGPSMLLLMGPEDPAPRPRSPTPEQEEDPESEDEDMWAARVQAMREREKEDDEEWARYMGYARSRDGSPRMRSPRGREGQLDPGNDRWPWQHETAEREDTQEGDAEEEEEEEEEPEIVLSRKPWSNSPPRSPYRPWPKSP